MKIEKKHLLVPFLFIFLYGMGKMLAIVSYEWVQLKNPSFVEGQKQMQDGLLVHNLVEKPKGQRMFMPVVIKTARVITKDKISFLKLYKEIDTLFFFLAFCGFFLLLRTLGYRMEQILLGCAALGLYTMFGATHMLPVYRWWDIPHFMFFIWGLYFLAANKRTAFFVTLCIMTVNREASNVLILIFIIQRCLEYFQRRRRPNRKEILSDGIFAGACLLVSLCITVFIGTVICKTTQPWGGTGFWAALLYYSKMNFTIDGLKYLFNWFNILLVLSLWGFRAKSAFIQAALFGAYFYVLSIFLVGGVFGEGEGMLIAIIPVLVIAAMEEIRRWKPFMERA